MAKVKRVPRKRATKLSITDLARRHRMEALDKFYTGDGTYKAWFNAFVKAGGKEF